MDEQGGGFLSDHPHGQNHSHGQFTDWGWFLKTYPRVRILTYSPRIGTRSKYLHNPWGVILTMEPNHHRRIQDAVGLFFFTTTNKQTNNHAYYIHRFKFPPTQHKGFALSQPKKAGSISQKSAHPVRKWHEPIGKQPHGRLTLLLRTKPGRLWTAPRVRPPFKGFCVLKKEPHHIGSMDRQAPRVAYVVLNRRHMRSAVVRMAGRHGIHELGQGV